MRLARLSSGLALASAGAALALLILEVALRLFAPQALLHDPDAFLPDSILGARLKPGYADEVVTTEFKSTWRINAGGYRGPLAAERGGRALRIVALGDSFTFGYGVEEEEAWPRLVESRLNRGRVGPDQVEVLNLGVGGYGTFQEALWLDEKQEALRPDLALLAFYVGNDPSDNLRTAPPPPDEAGAGSPGAVSPPAAAGGITRTEALKRWLGSRMHIYSLVSTRADDLLVRLGLRQIVYPFEMEVLMRHEPDEVAEAWRATRQALARLGPLGRQERMRVIVVIVPMKHQVSDSLWQKLLSHYRSRLATVPGFDRDRPQRILREMCEQEGLSVIDLLEGLRAAEGRSGRALDLYWPRDQHWNEQGHAEAARLIAEAIGPLTGSGFR